MDPCFYNQQKENVLAVSCVGISTGFGFLLFNSHKILALLEIRKKISLDVKDRFKLFLGFGRRLLTII
jgi:hypothetical protein